MTSHRYQAGDLAVLDGEEASARHGAFQGFDTDGRTVRVVEPFYDPDDDGDPGYWVVLAEPRPGDPDVPAQFVTADCLTPA